MNKIKKIPPSHYDITVLYTGSNRDVLPHRLHTDMHKLFYYGTPLRKRDPLFTLWLPRTTWRLRAARPSTALRQGQRGDRIELFNKDNWWMFLSRSNFSGELMFGLYDITDFNDSPFRVTKFVHCQSTEEIEPILGAPESKLERIDGATVIENILTLYD